MKFTFNDGDFGKKTKDFIDRLRTNAEALHGVHSYPTAEILDPTFLTAHTSFTSFDDLLEKWGVTPEQFNALTNEERDEKTRTTTKFSSWNEMSKAAAPAFGQRKLRE